MHFPFQEDLQILIGNVLDAFALIDPAKIIQKQKLHLLVHLLDNIPRFGPAIRYSTEVYECYNAIFRLCSVYSNHLAPSRDIARQFASMDTMKHIISGGYWKQGGEWVHAAPSVVALLHHEVVLQQHLGWVPPQKTHAGVSTCTKSVVTIMASNLKRTFEGLIRAEGKRKASARPWGETKASLHLPVDVHRSQQCRKVNWRSGITLTAQSGDLCAAKSWVVAESVSPLMRELE